MRSIKVVNLTKMLYTVFLSAVCFYAQAQLPGKIEKTNQVLLPNGWKLSPAGRQLGIGDLPLNLQLSSSGRLMAVTNNGQSTQSVQLIDPRNEKLLDTKVLSKSWYGLVFSHDEKQLYVSAGYDNCILDFRLQDNKLGTPDTIRLGLPWPKKIICPTGLAVDKSNSRLYAVTKNDSCLYIIDPNTRAIVKKTKMPGIAYSCILSPDEKTLYVSLWGDAKVAAF